MLCQILTHDQKIYPESLALHCSTTLLLLVDPATCFCHFTVGFTEAEFNPK